MPIHVLPRRHRSRRLVCLCSIVIIALLSGGADSFQWTCDELTPSLCELSVTGGSFNIRGVDVNYRRFKRKQPILGGQFLSPLITLHGGPSWPSDYLLPLRQLACRGAAEVILYDQAGCGQSALPNGANISLEYPHLLTTEYYSEEELPALIEHLSLDRYHILAHSWGTILAQLYLLNAKNTSGLASLTLSGPLSDAKSYIDAQWDETEGNLGSLPPFVQHRIKKLEEKQRYDSAEYEALDEVLSTFFTLRTAPAPDCFAKSASGLNKEIYVGMQGASEFTLSGVLGELNVTGRLHEMEVPVLLTHGEFDTMRPSIVKTMQGQIKLAERKMFPHSGHVSMIDDAGLMNDVVADFLERVEASQRGAGAPHFVPKNWEESTKSQVDPKMRWVTLVFTTLIAFFVGLLVGKRRKYKDGYSPIE
mmetsp:Transcript_12331/g.20531  ORF Transcript_12331/g.20531 Transcript_12331/m.20531 type:complete len:420 (-) Transcript_12331:606-1865(-)